MTATVYTVATDDEREQAIAAIEKAVLDGRTAVIPTDTVYGIAADAFSRGGVQQLLNAKGRSRRMPPPVLIADSSVLPGLADDLSADAHALAEAFWPGALTLIVFSQPSLNWDLGETQGTVGLRVPDDEFAREILRRTGPLAVSSANRTGQPAATTGDEAVEQLGERVEAIVDAGPRPEGRGAEARSSDAAPSTIIDVTGQRPVVVRLGALSMERIRSVAPTAVTQDELDREKSAEAETEHSPADPDDAGGEDASETRDPINGPGDGPRAADAADGSVEAGLFAAGTTAATPSRTEPVDQLRRKVTDGAGSPGRPRPAATRPLGVEEARHLLFPDQERGED